jgi:hypothetical protein
VALHIAAAILGPLSMAGLGWAVAWAAAPFAERRWLWLAALSACVGPAILVYGLFGVAHHHVASAIIPVMMAGWAARAIIGRAPRHAGIAIGAWAGLGIWLTPETVPLSVMVFGALWVTWIGRRRSRYLGGIIAHTGLSLALVVGLAWLVDPPDRGYAADSLDRISVVFVVLAGAMALTGVAVAVLDPLLRRPVPRLLGTGLFGVMCAGLWVALFADVLFGVPGAVTDDAARTLFRDIGEMAPVSSVSQWMNYLLTGSLTVATLAVLACRLRSLPLAYTALCGVILIMFGQMHIRFAAYPEALGAVMLPVIVSLLGRSSVSWPEWKQPLPRMVTIVMFVLVPFAAGMSQPSKPARAQAMAQATHCPGIGLTPVLAPYEGQVVLADVGRSPELLYRTGVLTVGSLYHRNPAGFMRLRDAWRSTEDGPLVPLSFASARIAYVLFCPRGGRSLLVHDLPETTLLDRLRRNEVPGWLEQVSRDAASGHVLYRVRSDDRLPPGAAPRPADRGFQHPDVPH